MTDEKIQAEKDYRLGMKIKDIAKKYGVNENTIKSWAKRNDWSRKKSATSDKKVATKNKKSCTEKVAVAEKKVAPKDLKTKLFESVDSNAELTEKQRLFCVFYVQCFNATQAYLKAFGGSKIVAGVSGHELLKNPKVQSEIKRLKDESRKHFHIGLEDYVKFLLSVVGAKISDFVKFGQRDEPVVGVKGIVMDKQTGKPLMQSVNFIELLDSDSVDTSAISEMKQVKGDVTIKLEDRKWAWKELVKIFGLDEIEKSHRELSIKKLETDIAAKGNFDKRARFFLQGE